ncbi:hypothetical protein GOP47_0015073 [Adiantum capillus-veneris]|uniref:Uncharacterized protein n=1 Tax=Adiantum capillus-veneris TaxID=13818 RepID=A0A9D4UMX1_ADICA|nr:hypothetical protein GOP47_0015073 [Adiantum capillus-veneris]
MQRFETTGPEGRRGVDEENESPPSRADPVEVSSSGTGKCTDPNQSRQPVGKRSSRRRREEPSPIPKRRKVSAHDREHWLEELTPLEFERPATTPQNKLLQAHRPNYSTDMLQRRVYERKGPYDWVPMHFSNEKKTVKMTVETLVGDVAQSTEGLAEGMGIACSLLSLRMAEWMLRHPPEHPVPSAGVLNKVLYQTEHDVSEHELFIGVDKFPELDKMASDHAPNLRLPLALYLYLPEDSDDQLLGDEELIFALGRFDSMWDNHIATCRNEVFIVAISNHFFVLRIDDRGKFFVLDTLGRGNMDRASVLQFGNGTLFTLEHRAPRHSQLCEATSSAKACKYFFKYFVGQHHIHQKRGYETKVTEELHSIAFYLVRLKGSPKRPLEVQFERQLAESQMHDV